MKRRSLFILTEIIITIFIVLFLSTALDKLLHQQRFINALGTSPWLKPYRLVIAPVIPSLEIAIVVLLIIPLTKRVGLICATILMSLFTIYIAVMLAVSTDLPCGCGGIINGLSWKGHLLFNSIFTALGIIGCCTSKILKRASKYPAERPRIARPAG